MIQPGHGVRVLVNEDPEGAPTEFSLMGELSADFSWPQLMRPATEVLAHERGVEKVVFGVFKRGPLSIESSYDPEDGVHEAVYQHLRFNRQFGIRLEHPPSGRVWVVSGGIESIDGDNPIGEGVMSLSWTFRISDSMIINGEIWDGAAEP